MLSNVYRSLRKLQPGDNVLIEIEGVSRIKAKYIGWYEKQFIITSLPPIPGIKQQIYNNQSLTLHFLIDGVIYSANTVVLHHTFKPTGLLFLLEPEKLENIRIRKSDRIPCLVPAELIDEQSNNSYPGLIINLSVGGAGFVFKDFEDEERFKKDQRVLLKFTLLTGEKELKIPCIVRRTFFEEDKLGVGLQFSSEAKEDIKIIESYIKDISAILK